MENVTLKMQDQLTGKIVTRTIDATNAMTSGSNCWELREKSEQEKNLNNWIQERGNAQHEADLVLISWEFN